MWDEYGVLRIVSTSPLPMRWSSGSKKRSQDATFDGEPSIITGYDWLVYASLQS